ncbi:hypothetical protein ACIQZO_05675 [Streptomyces sp. NPDC097617]
MTYDEGLAQRIREQLGRRSPCGGGERGGHTQGSAAGEAQEA